MMPHKTYTMSLVEDDGTLTAATWTQVNPRFVGLTREDGTDLLVAGDDPEKISERCSRLYQRVGSSIHILAEEGNARSGISEIGLLYVRVW